MAKQDLNAERAAKLVEALQQQRDKGTDYPLTVARLRELGDAQATDEEIFKALAKKPSAEQIALAAKKDLNSPIVLAEDAAQLASSPMLLQYALGKLASADKPLHPVAKVVGKVDKSLQPDFEEAINKWLSEGSFPQGVGMQEVKGKQLLYLEQFPPPPPPPVKKSPAVELSEQMLAALNALHEQGNKAPLLADLTGADTKPALIKKAVAEEPFSSQAALITISKTQTLALLRSERDEFLGSDRLLLALLDAKTTTKKPFTTVALLADALPEDQREPFIAAQGRKVEAGTLPPEVAVRQEGESRVLCLKSHLPTLALLGEKVLAGLRRHRDTGDYPISLMSLLREELADAEPDVAGKLQADPTFKKLFKSQVIQAVSGNMESPVVLAGDEERLASSPMLIEFAVGLLSTAEQPLHPLNKIAGKLDKSIRDAFTAALERHIAEKTLPASVIAHEAKGRPHLRLAQHPLPRVPSEVLAERMLAGLHSAREAGTYPLPLSELVAKVDPGAGDKLVKAALDLDKFSLVTAVPGSLTSLVALAGDHDRLAADPRLVVETLTALRTTDNQAVPITDLGKKLAQELKPIFTEAIEKHRTEGTLPVGVGCLVIKKKPHLFLLSDAAGAPAVTFPPPAKEGPTAAPQAEQPKPGVNFARMFDEAFEKLDQGSHGLVSLVQLRQEVPVERDQFDEELNHLRRAGRYTLTAAESRHGVSPEEREAGIVEQGNLLLYVSKREEE